MSVLDFDLPWGYLNVGNIFNLVASFGLLFSIIKSKSCAGVSGRTQLSFLLAYGLRLLVDVLTFPDPDYDRIMALLIVIVLTATTCCIYIWFRGTYEAKWDTFEVQYMLPVLFVFSLVVHRTAHESFLIGVLSAFTRYLEMLAFLPQFSMSFRMHQVKPAMVYYVLGLFCYQAFYGCYWIYMRHYSGRDPIASVACLIQLLTYCAFFMFLKVKNEDRDLDKSSEKRKNQPLTDGSSPQPGNGIWIIGGKDAPGISMAHRLYGITKRECHGLFGDNTRKRRSNCSCDCQCPTKNRSDSEQDEKASVTSLPAYTPPPDYYSVTVDLPEKPAP